ncbi:MAG: hypothetical protein Kow0042_13590 [Calditrichia bacterium]
MKKNSFSILIVDDEYYLGQMLAQALMQENMDALALTEVDSAIDWLHKKSFDLVVSDIYLPGKTGMDLFNYAKNHNIEVPFIFMTGNPDLEMAIDFLTRGGYDYILKPFMIPDFINKVKSVIQTHKIKRQEKKLVRDLRLLLARRLSELRIFQDVFESTDDGLVVTDVDGNIVKVNPGFERLTGMSSAQLLHKPLNILQKSILPDLNFNQIISTINTKNTWHGELFGKRGNNQPLFVSISLSPICNEEANIFAYTGIFKDVTEQRKVEQALITSLRKMNLAQEAIIFGLAQLAEHRDHTTGFHLERIRSYCKRIAEALMERGMYSDVINPKFIDTLYRTAPLHDIGKVGIPDYILLKKDKLTEPEFVLMKSHTEIGFKTLNSILHQFGDMQFLKMGIEITYCHHEKWDGSGYPRGLKGDQIPLSARILAIADVYDALTTERSYKDAYDHRRTLDLMKKERGKHFAPDILDVFLEIEKDIQAIYLRFEEDKLLDEHEPEPVKEKIPA